jgi:Alpha-L-arabinofuranosidase B (ABFB) domain
MNQPALLALFTVSLAIISSGFAAPATVADADLIGKTVVIKINKEGPSCLRLENGLPKIAAFDKSAPDSCLYKVVQGIAPGTIAFQPISQEGFFLRHSSFHLILAKDLNDDASFRIVAPLRGNQGLSLQSFNYPTHHLAVVEKGQIDLLKDIKDPRKAVFFVEEPPK